MNAQNVIKNYTAGEALDPYVAAIADVSADNTAILPTAANQRALGIVDEHGSAPEAGDGVGLLAHGWGKALLGAACTAGDRLNVHGITGALKPAVASLAVNMTAPEADFIVTANAQGKEGDRWSLALIDPGGASATLAVEIYDHYIRVTLGRESSAVDTTLNDLITLLEANAEFDANLTIAKASGEDGTGLLNALAKTYLSGGANDFCEAMKSGSAGEIIPVQID